MNYTEEINYSWDFCEFCDVDHLSITSPKTCSPHDLKIKVNNLKAAIDKKDEESGELRKEIKELNKLLPKESVK